jgi:hypothetical protein
MAYGVTFMDDYFGPTSVIDLRPHMRSVIVSVGVTGHCLDDNTPGAARGSRLYALTLVSLRNAFLFRSKQTKFIEIQQYKRKAIYLL